MSSYKKFTTAIILLNIFLVIACNIVLKSKSRDWSYGQSRVEVSRVIRLMEEGRTIDEINLEDYPDIVDVKKFNPQAATSYNYVVEEIDGQLYRFELKEHSYERIIITVNIALLCLLIFNISLLLYIGKRLIKPFNDMTELAAELAKGNLATPIKADKSRYFGKFIWSMDMLREKLEDDRQRELELIRDRKTLILSLSHDIKTPLAAIDLYTHALATNLYEKDEEKQAVVKGIQNNISIIKSYVNQINTATREDFLSLSVNRGEVYLYDILDYIEDYYSEKMLQNHTDFIVEKSENCLVYGDRDRIIEVLQNIIENALKYGDGRKISLFCCEEDDCKLISIENTGCTIKQGELNHIFDSFYRGTNSENVKGSGLGLYIARHLMQMMDGEIFAKIENDIFKLVVVLRKL